MREIQIPFNNWSRERIHNNTKHATCRYKKYGVSGDMFLVDDTRFILNGVMQIRLDDVIKYGFWADEGCVSPNEFKQIWRMIHPKRGYHGDDVVWIHFFLRYEPEIGVC